MTPPATSPTPSPTGAPARPLVRLDVRLAGGAPARHQLTGGEFLIGGAGGCNLTLPGADLPHLICQLAVAADGVHLRRLAENFPVLVNGQPVPEGQSVDLKSGDRIAVGPADVGVTLVERTVLRPTFVPFDPPAPPTPFAQPDTTPPPSADRTRLQAEWQALDHARARVAADAAELDADRELWHRRRAEIEAECQQLRDAATAPRTDQAADLARREAAVADRERDLENMRLELEAVRTRLAAEYTDRRDQLAQTQDSLHGAIAELHARQQRFDDESRHLEPRLAELRTRQDQLTAAFAELEAQRTAVAAARDELRRDQDAVAADRRAADADRADRDQVVRRPRRRPG